MYCRNCGKEINENASICLNCGASVKLVAKDSNSMAIVGFIMSFFVSIAGLICSIVGYRNAVNGNADGKGLALAGIILSAIRLAFDLFVAIIYISMFIALISSSIHGPQALLTLAFM